MQKIKLLTLVIAAGACLLSPAAASKLPKSVVLPPGVVVPDDFELPPGINLPEGFVVTQDMVNQYLKYMESKKSGAQES